MEKDGKRLNEIKKASAEYQIAKCPIAIGGDAFADMAIAMNVNPSFVEGAKWADRWWIARLWDMLEKNDGRLDENLREELSRIGAEYEMDYRTNDNQKETDHEEV